MMLADKLLLAASLLDGAKCSKKDRLLAFRSLREIATPIRQVECAAATRPAAAQMREAAGQLAAQVEHEMSGLTEGQRYDLRYLTCQLLTWADAIDPGNAVIAEEVICDDVVVRFPISERSWH